MVVPSPSEFSPSYILYKAWHRNADARSLSPVATGNQVPALVFLAELALHHDTNTAAALPVMLMSGAHLAHELVHREDELPQRALGGTEHDQQFVFDIDQDLENTEANDASTIAYTTMFSSASVSAAAIFWERCHNKTTG
jgi:hypothetical protein